MRLTKLNGVGLYEPIKCFECGCEKAGIDLENCGLCDVPTEVENALGMYEDACYTEDGTEIISPAELAELAAAKQDKRLFVEPKEGDRVYVIGVDCDLCNHPECTAPNVCPETAWSIFSETYSRDQHLLPLVDGDIYANRQAAEAALKERESNG